MNIGFPNLTAIYCSLLAIWLFILSIRVIGLRGNPVFTFIAQGKGDVELLNRAIESKDTEIEQLRKTCKTNETVIQWLVSTCIDGVNM